MISTRNARDIPALSDILTGAGWAIPLSEVDEKGQRWLPEPDVIIYDVERGLLRDTFRAYCLVHLAPLLALAADWETAWHQILDEVWECLPDQGGTREQVKTVVKRLRRKIERDPGNPHYIVSARTVGYRLRNQTQWDEEVNAWA